MSTPAKAYHHGDLRRALLDAAGTPLGAGGDGAVSLQECARLAGAPPTAADRHVADEAALLAALVARHVTAFAMAFIMALAAKPLPVTGPASARFSLARPGPSRPMFGPLFGRAGQHPGLRDAADRAFKGPQRLVFRGFFLLFPLLPGSSALAPAPSSIDLLLPPVSGIAAAGGGGLRPAPCR